MGSGRDVWALALVSLAVWAFILPGTQAEQRLRRQAEGELRSGRVREALALMTTHARSDFPPQWDPPPRVGYGQRHPPLLDVLEAIAEQPPAAWVHAVYVEKFRQYLSDRFNLYEPQGDDAGRVIRLLRRLPEGPVLAAEQRGILEQMIEPGSGLAQGDIEDLKAILGKEGKEPRRPWD